MYIEKILKFGTIGKYAETIRFQKTGIEMA